MTKFISLLVVMLGVHAAPFGQQTTTSGPRRDAFPLGTVIPKVVAIAKSDQSYALYLPTSYSAAKRWPIVYAFDPGANGSSPVGLMKDAAERYGYIIVGSNNSRNGSWPVESEAAQAMFQDTHDRLSIDSQRLYFTGFSGGARVAASIVQMCKCAAGLFLNGAGFHPEAFAASETPFAVFSAVGTYDFNYPELVQTDEDLEKLHYPNALRHFSGTHQWAPANVMEEALAWFRLQAMKTGRETRDDSFISMEAAQEIERARSLEQRGNLYFAWKEYRQAAEAFAGLADISALQARSAALGNDKAVRDGAKREKVEFEAQTRMNREISSGLAALQDNPMHRAEIRANLEQQIADLRSRTDHEKREEKLRVLKRALAGVMVDAVERGLALLDEKKPGEARDYFELALIAGPDSTWALSNAAVARAMDGDRKGAIAALRQAKAHSIDPDRLVVWMKDEPAFEKFHGSPDFTALLEVPLQH